MNTYIFSFDAYYSLFATPIRECRVCGNGDLVKVLDLGSQAATGMFPKSAEERVFNCPLKLIKCIENPSGDTCGLVQLGHRYDPAVLYGDHYGYRSGLNASMVAHLRGKAERIKQRVALTSGDAIPDIESNDGTFLATLIEPGVTALRMDPSAEKFRKYYRPEIQIIPEFFSAASFRRHFGAHKLKVVTAIAMFYESWHPQLEPRIDHGISMKPPPTSEFRLILSFCFYGARNTI